MYSRLAPLATFSVYRRTVRPERFCWFPGYRPFLDVSPGFYYKIIPLTEVNIRVDLRAPSTRLYGLFTHCASYSTRYQAHELHRRLWMLCAHGVEQRCRDPNKLGVSDGVNSVRSWRRSDHV